MLRKSVRLWCGHHMLRIFALMLGLLCLSPTAVHGLGEDGHRIVCEIAYHELSPKTRLKVATMIGRDVMAERFAEACIWADRAPKSRYKDVVLWHFLAMDRDDATVDPDDCSTENGCLFIGIAHHSRILRDESEDTDRRLEALKFLGHWLGDLHSPLNIAASEDVYGKRIAVRTPSGRRTDMRHVWEVRLLVEYMEERFPPVREDERWLVLAEHLMTDITDDQRKKWTQGNVNSWAQETWDITRLPSTSYIGADPDKSYVLNTAYFRQNGERLTKHLTRAGVRLAHMLDEILGGE